MTEDHEPTRPTRLRNAVNATERLALLIRSGRLSASAAEAIAPDGLAAADAIASRIENAVGAFAVPIGVAEHFVVNGEPRLVAMATEERSVVAAASFGAKLARDGFAARINGSAVATGQILFTGVENPALARDTIMTTRDAIVRTLRDEPAFSAIGRRGAGLTALRARTVRATRRGPLMLVVEIDVDPGDAMGAGVVTDLAERAARILSKAVGARPAAAICTNARSGWTVHADAEWTDAAVPADVLRRIRDLSDWASADRVRATTHNKGIMNAVTAVCLATGQDTRAVEAACHDLASNGGTYRPLSTFRLSEAADGTTVHGMLTLCLPVGTVGGATTLPCARACREIMGVRSARDLAQIVAAAALAQNFAALRCLADEGIAEGRRRSAR